MCVLCELDFNKLENTIIEEFNYFYIVPSVGCLVDGYLLIITKRHIECMSLLTNEELSEYKKIIKKYRNIFYNVYGNYPIIFEHGSPVVDDMMRANSVTHAHTHIVNCRFSNEKDILKSQNFVSLNNLNKISKTNNYIMYINNMGKKYITYKFDGVSQLMRIYIANEVGLGVKFNWKKYMLSKNLKLTVEKITKYNKSN